MKQHAANFKYMQGHDHKHYKTDFIYNCLWKMHNELENKSHTVKILHMPRLLLQNIEINYRRFRAANTDSDLCEKPFHQ